MTQIYKLKFCLIGEYASGKTSLVKNFVEGAYSKDYRPTIGANLFIKKLGFKNSSEEDYNFTITCWDIAGQERWTSMRHTYYRGTQGVFVVGDLTRKNSFQQIKNFWIPDFRENTDGDIPIILLANKNDLKPEIAEEDVRQIAKSCGITKVIFTSAKTGYHTGEAFISLIKSCVGVEDLTAFPLK
ncbi:MAG: Rab family GTPase [Promethearchaeota archaeon]